MILVVGATGLVGSEVCGMLAARARRVRALVRSAADPAKVEGLRAHGVEMAAGDLRDPASLREACRGVSTIIATASSLPFGYQPGANTPDLTDRDGYLSLIEDAARAGVERFIYVSFLPVSVAFPLQDAKRAVEARLRTSGLTYTILQAALFDEIWLSPGLGFDYAHAKATIYGTGENPISWISYLDVAQFAVASLSNPAAFDVTLPLGGPEALSPLQVVKIFEAEAGRRFEVSHVPVETLHAQWAAAEDAQQKSFSGLMLGYADGAPVDMADTLANFSLTLRTVADYARRVCAPTTEKVG